MRIYLLRNEMFYVVRCCFFIVSKSKQVNCWKSGQSLVKIFGKFIKSCGADYVCVRRKMQIFSRQKEKAAASVCFFLRDNGKFFINKKGKSSAVEGES